MKNQIKDLEHFVTAKVILMGQNISPYKAVELSIKNECTICVPLDECMKDVEVGTEIDVSKLRVKSYYHDDDRDYYTVLW